MHFVGRASLLLLFLASLLPLAAGAQEAGFQTEIDLSFSYEGGKTDEPLVVLGGAPSLNFAFRADSTSRNLGVAATRFFRRIEDDGQTPYSLLAFVSHPSHLAARIAIQGASRDSEGVAIGSASSLESRLQGDSSAVTGRVEGAYYFEPESAVIGSLSTLSSRETDVLDSVERPSGRAMAGSFGFRSGETGASLGVSRHFGAESSVSLEGTFRDVSVRRSDRFLFTSGGNSREELRLSGRALGLRISGRQLLLKRSIAVDAGAAYETTHTDLDVTEPSAASIDSGRSIRRQLGAGVAYFPARYLELGAILSYETRSDVAGIPIKRRNAWVRSALLGGTVRWFPRPGASVRLSFSRQTVDTITPPESDSFQKLAGTADRIELTGSLRF